MLDRYHSEKTGTNYENQSATVFIIPNHGSEVLNGRDQRVFFFPRSGSVSFIDHAKGKKNPLAPRVGLNSPTVSLHCLLNYYLDYF